jgi:Rrf2 family protein
VPRADIAQRQAISADYLAQLLSDLQRAGLAIGVKGPGGGYHLGRTASQIRVGDVVRAVEGPIVLVDCLNSCDAATCPRAATCITRPLWEEISSAVEGILDGLTLQDLIERGGRGAPPTQNAAIT